MLCKCAGASCTEQGSEPAMRSLRSQFHFYLNLEDPLWDEYICYYHTCKPLFQEEVSLKPSSEIQTKANQVREELQPPFSSVASCPIFNLVFLGGCVSSDHMCHSWIFTNVASDREEAYTCSQNPGLWISLWIKWQSMQVTRLAFLHTFSKKCFSMKSQCIRPPFSTNTKVQLLEHFQLN